MGYGYGRTTYHGNAEARDNATGERRAAVLANHMVAHVWNAAAQSFGRSHNGNFYFEGPTLFSYGWHYPVAHIAPDGVALLNSDGSSVTTEGKHKGPARSASRNRVRILVPALDELLPAYGVGRVNNEPDASAARRYAEKHAEALAASIEWPAQTGGAYVEQSPDGRTALQYIADSFGFGRSAAKILREAIAKREREARDKAKRELASRKAEARRLADMPAKEWRECLASMLVAWNGQADFARLATRLNRFRREAKALDLSDKRKATLWAREKRLREIHADWSYRNGIAQNRLKAREDIRTIRRTLPEVTSESAPATATDWNNRVRSARALAEAAGRLEESKRLPFLARRRLAILAQEARKREADWSAIYNDLRQREREEEERLRAATAEEQKSAWLAGTAPRLFRQFDCPEGGAALRVYGDELQTSHGAAVPLSHAVKAFRFLKLIRERGEEWKRNGHTIRVGHFQIDRIDSAGNFQAGCHNIKWQEVARIARALGVFDEAASAEAEERTAA